MRKSDNKFLDKIRESFGDEAAEYASASWESKKEFIKNVSVGDRIMFTCFMSLSYMQFTDLKEYIKLGEVYTVKSIYKKDGTDFATLEGRQFDDGGFPIGYFCPENSDPREEICADYDLYLRVRKAAYRLRASKEFKKDMGKIIKEKYKKDLSAAQDEFEMPTANEAFLLAAVAGAYATIVSIEFGLEDIGLSGMEIMSGAKQMYFMMENHDRMNILFNRHLN